MNESEQVAVLFIPFQIKNEEKKTNRKIYICLYTMKCILKFYSSIVKIFCTENGFLNKNWIRVWVFILVKIAQSFSLKLSEI